MPNYTDFNGGTLGGTGTVPTTRINAGGTLSPGKSVGIITVAGNLAFASAATYMVEVASRENRLLPELSKSGQERRSAANSRFRHGRRVTAR